MSNKLLENRLKLAKGFTPDEIEHQINFLTKYKDFEDANEEKNDLDFEIEKYKKILDFQTTSKAFIFEIRNDDNGQNLCRFDLYSFNDNQLQPYCCILGDDKQTLVENLEQELKSFQKNNFQLVTGDISDCGLYSVIQRKFPVKKSDEPLISYQIGKRKDLYETPISSETVKTLNQAGFEIKNLENLFQSF